MKASTTILIIAGVILFLVIAAPAWGQQDGQHIKLSWQPVRTDIHGNSIPGNVVAYRIYGSENGGPVSFVAQVTGVIHKTWLPTGCYTTEVTTLRTDLALESGMSNKEEFCIDPLTQDKGLPPDNANKPTDDDGIGGPPVPTPAQITVEKLYE